MQLWILAIRETSGHLGRTGVRAIMVAAALLALLVVTLNVKDFDSRRREYDDAVQARALEKVEQNGWKTELALRALRPPTVGSVFVRGLEKATPAYWDFAASGLKEGTFPASVIEGAEIGPLFDLESLIRILLGLLAITLGVESIAAERASGTLGALLSQPVGRTTLAAGKLIGGALTMSSAVGLAAIAGMAGTWHLMPELAATALKDPVPALILVSVIYLVTLYALGMIIGALVRPNGAALTLGVSLWICSALAAPPLVVFGAHTLATVTSRTSIELEMQRSQFQRDIETQERLGRTFSEYRRTVPIASREEAPAWMRARIDPQWTAEAAETRKILSAIELRWTEQVSARHEWTKRLSWATPSTAYLRAAAAVADTGDRFNARVNAAVRAYHRDLNAGLFDDPAHVTMAVPRPAPEGNEIMSYNRHTPKDRTFPLFQSPTRTQLQRWADSSSTLFALAVYCGLFVGLAVFAFPRTAR